VKPKTIGLIVNPMSGLGANHNLEVARLLVHALEPDHIYTGSGQFGEDALPTADVLVVENLTGSAATQAIALMAMKEGVDALAIIGGDGTMADVAFALHRNNLRCPILGIGAGSINAGELVMCKANQISELVNTDFDIKSVTALEASCNNQILALAFNDVVIGTTIVGTSQDKYCDWDANAFLEGQRIAGMARPIDSQSAWVAKSSATKRTLVSEGNAIGTLVTGLAQNQHFFGKAIVGGVCLSTLVGIEAGCLVSDQPLVRTQFDQQAHRDIEPIRSAYVSLSKDEVIEIGGMSHPAVLCADGNPLKALHPDDLTHIRVLPHAVDVLRIVERN
jgi:NAD kinase